jgi:GNAT superfamily N-acetyltransferase
VAGYVIEPARPDDVAVLPAIEREAASLFAGMPIPLGVLEETTSLAELEAARQGGRLWVARAADGQVVGFAQVEFVGGGPHLEEMDVHPVHGRRGIGRRLVAAVQGWARAAGHPALSLTTFRDVPWNAPFYASCGFRVLGPAELSPALRAVVEEEAARGLDPATRVVMRWGASPQASG